MKVWSNDTLIEFDISTIDSITFEVKTEYVGVFSVANNKRVAFAPGNLQYIPTADTWLFAANQYDYIGTRNMVNQAFADTIDLFAWSTDTDPSTAWGVTLEENNDLFAGNFSDADRVLIYALHDKLKDDKKLRKVAKTSDPQVFAESIFPKTFDEVAQDSYVEQTEAFTSLFQNKSKYNAIMSALAGMLYREFNRPRV